MVAANVAISTAVSRIADSYARHGFAATVHRAVVAAKRAVFSGRSVLFYSDLAAQVVPPAELPSFLAVERKQSSAELDPIDLEAMTGFWNSKLAQRNVKERFEKGASLWLIKSEGRLAGYGWTLRGRTIEPHYFPIGQDDAHLFDFHVFPQHRGRGMNPFLVDHILRGLATEGVARALIEAAEWNHPQLSSLRKTRFRTLGYARKLTFFGRTLVCWPKNTACQSTASHQSQRSAA